MKDHLESSIFGDHEEHRSTHVEETHAGAADRAGASSREQELAAPQARRTAGPRKAASGGAPKGKPSVFRRLVVIVLALAVIGGGVAVAYKALRPVVEGFLESNDYPGPGTGEIRVTVDQGAGGSAIAKTLADAGRRQVEQGLHRGREQRPEERRHPAGRLRDEEADEGVRRPRDPRRPQEPHRSPASPSPRVSGRARSTPSCRSPRASRWPSTSRPPRRSTALGLPPSAKGNLEGYLFPASYEFGPTRPRPTS